MSSRIIHARVKDRTLYTVMDLLELNGFTLAGRPVSTLVSKALDALANSCTAVYPDDMDFSTSLNKRLGLAPIELKGVDLSQMNRNLAKVDEEENPISIEENPTSMDEDPIRQEIKRRVDALHNAEVEVRGDIVNKDFNPKAAAKNIETDLDITNRISIDKIKRIAPKDRFATAAENDDLMTTALEVVYAHLPIEDWGSNIAQNLLTKTYNNLAKYGDQIGNEKGENNA